MCLRMNTSVIVSTTVANLSPATLNRKPKRPYICSALVHIFAYHKVLETGGFCGYSRVTCQQVIRVHLAIKLAVIDASLGGLDQALSVRVIRRHLSQSNRNYCQSLSGNRCCKRSPQNTFLSFSISLRRPCDLRMSEPSASSYIQMPT
eukprot:14786_3